MDSKRLVIYYAPSSTKRLELYSEYFLRKILDNIEDLVVISVTAKLQISDEKIKEKLLHNIVIGQWEHSIVAYHEGINYLGANRLKAYSEITCISDDIMGPVYEMDSLFESMKKSDCAVWSITKQHPTPLNYLDYSGDNLQAEYMHPSFLSFKSFVMEDFRVLGLFDDINNIEAFKQSLVDAKALFFTTKLCEFGYSYTTYVQTEDIKKMYYNPLLMIPKEMISMRKCPVFSKESFIGDYDAIISNTAGQATVLLYEYLRSETDYDVDMIWETILKTGHQQDINHNLHLNYILSSKQCDVSKISKVLKEKKVALVMHLYFPDLLVSSLHYAQSMPECSDVYITTNTLEKKKEIEEIFQGLVCNKLEVRLIENRGRDVSSLLTGVKDVIMDYDYVCFVHDKKSAQVVPGSIGHDFGYQCLENTLGTKEFVANVICTFYDNERLGMLSPMYPIHGNYFSVNGDFDWGGNYNITKQLANELKLTVPISQEKSPVAPLGTMFWFRPKALKILYACDWEYDDFPQEPNGTDATLLHAVERIYSYVTQQQGFYPAIVGTDLFANMSLTNLTDFLQGINRSAKKYRGYVSYQQLLYIIEVLGYETQDIERLRQENEWQKSRINELIPQTSFKWQLKNRVKRMLNIKKENE